MLICEWRIVTYFLCNMKRNEIVHNTQSKVGLAGLLAVCLVWPFTQHPDNNNYTILIQEMQ